MKSFRKLLCFALAIVAVIVFNNTKSLAAETQYTANVIPVMTSDTSSDGNSSAISVWRPGVYHDAYHAFDGSSTHHNTWASKDGDPIPGSWLEYDFTKTKCITKYTITPRVEGTVGESPKSWTFEAWDSSINNWVELDRRSNITDWTGNVKKEFTFINTKFYNNYRIFISENCGSTRYVAIGELEMMETVSIPAPSVIDGNKAILEIVMTNGTIKEYDLTAAELKDYLTWYDNRSDGNGKSYFKIIKRSNVKPFISRNEYLSFDKIYSFEVKDYND